MKRLASLILAAVLVAAVLLLAVSARAQAHGPRQRAAVVAPVVQRPHFHQHFQRQAFVQPFVQPFYFVQSAAFVQSYYAPSVAFVQPFVQPFAAQPLVQQPLAYTTQAPVLSLEQGQCLQQVQAFAPAVTSYPQLLAFASTGHYDGLPLAVRQRVVQHFPAVRQNLIRRGAFRGY